MLNRHAHTEAREATMNNRVGESTDATVSSSWHIGIRRTLLYATQKTKTSRYINKWRNIHCRDIDKCGTIFVLLGAPINDINLNT
jgi:hypothetical protein